MSDFLVIALDMAGTTVMDDGTVEASFLAAIDDVGAPDDYEPAAMLDYVRTTMGQSKIEVFTHLFGGDRERAVEATAAFEHAYAARLDGCRPVEGAVEAMAAVRSAGNRVALTTGFSAQTQLAIIDTLGWNDAIDLALAPSDTVRGRPHPDLALTALLRLGGARVQNLVVVGDTTSDMASGVRAGAGVVAGVLTGAHGRDELLAAGATHVIDSVADLPTLLERDNLNAVSAGHPH